ncbi:hypothetical protein QL285_009061 [Trifolium repens]|nr:hypothetical protein QL285_009061 [Trifolium repens]
MKVVGLFRIFPTHVQSSNWINVAPVMADLVKQTCQARPGELVASAGQVPLLLHALTRPELALGSPVEFSSPKTYLFLKNMIDVERKRERKKRKEAWRKEEGKRRKTIDRIEDEGLENPTNPRSSGYMLLMSESSVKLRSDVTRG